MQFALNDWTAATCTHVNKRTENHGNELVHSKDLFWKIEGPNTLLDLVNAGLRHAIYKHAGTQVLPGVEDVTPELRCALLEGPFPIKYEGSGYMLTVKFGEVSGEQIELGGSELGKMKVDPKEGGTALLLFRTSHTGLSMGEMGRLDTFDGKQMQILLAPPSLQAGTLPDKKPKKGPADTKTTPFKFTVPPEGGIVDTNPAKDATEVFIEANKVTPIDAKAQREAERAAKKTAKPKK